MHTKRFNNLLLSIVVGIGHGCVIFSNYILYKGLNKSYVISNDHIPLQELYNGTMSYLSPPYNTMVWVAMLIDIYLELWLIFMVIMNIVMTEPFIPHGRKIFVSILLVDMSDVLFLLYQIKSMYLVALCVIILKIILNCYQTSYFGQKTESPRMHPMTPKWIRIIHRVVLVNGFGFDAMWSCIQMIVYFASETRLNTHLDEMNSRFQALMLLLNVVMCGYFIYDCTSECCWLSYLISPYLAVVFYVISLLTKLNSHSTPTESMIILIELTVGMVFLFITKLYYMVEDYRHKNGYTSLKIFSKASY